MADILIIGASRGVGLATVAEALAAGHRVRALARHPEAIPGEAPALQRLAGSALDRATVEAAVAGTEAVLLTLGARNLLDPCALFSGATRLVIDAMKRHGVRRLIAVTGLGAGDSRGHGGFLYDTFFFPLVLARVYADKDVQEMMIKASGLDWTIARPGLLTNGPRTGQYRVLTEARDWRMGSISRADVAHFLVAQISDRSCLGRTPLLIG